MNLVISMKLLKRLLIILIIAIIVVIAFIGINGYIVYHDALKEINLKDKVEQIRNNEDFTLLNDVSIDFRNAIIAVEDHRFYTHSGVDYIGTTRAIFVNVKTNSLSQGGSTITQQLAKNMYFSNNTDIIRKIAEIFIALDLERNYSKDEILELYINHIYYGNGYYCIGDASKGYFNKSPSEMSKYESTLLAGVPNAPSVYAPTANLNLAEKRQNKVLSSMLEYGYLTEEQVNSIKAEQKSK